MKYSQIDPEYARRKGLTPPSEAPPPKPSRRPPGEFLREHLGHVTIKDIAYLVGLAFTALTWAQSRASKEEVEAARRQCIDANAAALASALAPVQTHEKALDKRAARNDQRWDRLDAWHARAFASPFKTPAPKFGPTAEKRGEVRYEDEEDE